MLSTRISLAGPSGPRILKSILQMMVMDMAHMLLVSQFSAIMIGYVAMPLIFNTARQSLLPVATCAFCVYCLGTVMGNTYGLAKKATAIAVKVLNDFGGGNSAYVHHVHKYCD